MSKRARPHQITLIAFQFTMWIIVMTFMIFMYNIGHAAVVPYLMVAYTLMVVAICYFGCYQIGKIWAEADKEQEA